MGSIGAGEVGVIVIVLVSLLVTLVLVVGSVVLMVRIFGKVAAQAGANQRTLATGVSATARILTVGQTGTTINDQPMLAITLEVTPPPPSQPFSSTTQCLVPMIALARIQPGAVIPVKFDPANPSQIAIDFRQMGYV